VAYLNEADRFLPLAQSLDDSVDFVPCQPIHHVCAQAWIVSISTSEAVLVIC
jgi:hypothetical protein